MVLFTYFRFFIFIILHDNYSIQSSFELEENLVDFNSYEDINSEKVFYDSEEDDIYHEESRPESWKSTNTGPKRNFGGYHSSKDYDSEEYFISHGNNNYPYVSL